MVRYFIKTQNPKDALAKHLMEKHADDEIDTSSEDNFMLIPIEQVKYEANKHGDVSLRETREEFWITILNTFTPVGLNERAFNRQPKSHNKDQNFLPIVIPYSKTANKAVKIIKKHIQILQDKFNEDLDLEERYYFKLITAYSRHKNLSDFLVSSKLKSTENNPI